MQFILQNGYTNVHINVEDCNGRFPKYQFATNGINLPLKIIVDENQARLVMTIPDSDSQTKTESSMAFPAAVR